MNWCGVPGFFGGWESASARGSYEGSYQGIPFAMHNASLTHVWEVRDPMPDDPHNTRTCSKTIFKGLFLVCRMRRPVAQEAFVLPGSPRPGFGPELENWEQQLRRAVDARELRMSFRGDLMFAAFATDRQIMLFPRISTRRSLRNTAAVSGLG